MRNAALLSSLVLLGGCAGFGKLAGDGMSFPGSNPNAPGGEAENLRRARGEAAVELPILPAAGNLWPGPPAPLPTLGDVSKDRGRLGDGLPADAGGAELPEGGSMSAGEQAEIRGGVQDFSSGGLPSAVRDDAAHYGAGQRAATIVIPNGDGTSTIIAPDGTVRTVKDSPTTPR
ncbi:hypothetical protein AA13595_1108 [Gluconacetobacter johannae DSM 13595]|uniref:DUF3035 domain-containing protein n=1 Tax=Gluconacetobacter johannae TaxID=112140 RepID=A0A7W4P516_9PROT|nr:hypothetical protein [Gluconacetobacter johannae]MBB2175708.1 hypothetical protein [Gluconacetobacter johannae]GBQ83148.1 hypothetical protein AA13595_1108 [Gluconacetobacter johannae DSM 13595]